MSTTPLLDRLGVFFDDEEWEFERNDDGGVLHLIYADEGVEFDVYAQALEDEMQVLVLSVAPFAVPAARLDAAAEFATRANFGLPLGNFELSYDGGDLRYKTSIESSVEELSAEHLRSIVGANIAVMSAYLAGFRAVIFAGSRPEAVAAEIEG